MAALQISLGAETVFHVAGVPVTNSLLASWIVIAALALFSYIATAKLKKKPGRFQVFVELLVGGLFSFFGNIGGKHGQKFAPLMVTFFLYILISNWFGNMPGVGTIGIYESEAAKEAQKIVTRVFASTEPATHEVTAPAAEIKTGAEETKEVTEPKTAEHKTEEKIFVPLLRGPMADLNATLALALIAFGAIQYFGFKIGGPSYIKKFINFKGPIDFYVGVLETISDFSKILSFAFRLFGNVFAGEVLLAVMAFLCAFLLPIPFYALEFFVGAIQALVFAMLTGVFINVAVSHADHADHKHAEVATH
jgi:F-type H+-transporting ATPase subunit a